MHYISTDFGANGSSRFPFRARTNRQTNRQTRLNTLPTPVTILPAWVITENWLASITNCVDLPL